jgi:DNA polymerase-3 subunit alpha
LLAGVGMAIEAAEQSGAASGQNSLFGDMPDVTQHKLPEVPYWPEQEKLQQEKIALGFYFSGHPYAAYRKELSAFVRNGLAALKPQDQPQLLAGVVVGLRARMTSRGKMAFVTIDDATAQIEVMVGSELLMSHATLLKEDQLLFVEGKVSHDDFSGGLRVNARRLYDLASARSAYASLLKISCNGQADARKLGELLMPYRKARDAEEVPGCRVQINYRNADAHCELALGEQWRVELHDELLNSLRAWLSEENVKILYH